MTVWVVIGGLGAALVTIASISWWFGERLRQAWELSDGAPDGHIVWSSAADPGRASRSLRRLLGAGDGPPPSPRALLERVAEGDRAGLEDALAGLRRSNAELALPIALADGGSLLALGRRLCGRGRHVLWLRAAAGAGDAARDPFREVLETLSFPVWRRDAAGAITHCNRAYAVAVEAGDPGAVVVAGIELVGRAAPSGPARSPARPFARARLKAPRSRR